MSTRASNLGSGSTRGINRKPEDSQEAIREMIKKGAKTTAFLEMSERTTKSGVATV
jgi:hypothetical protein